MSGQQFTHEMKLFGWNAGREIIDRRLLLQRDILGDNDVDPERLAIDMFADPAQLLVKLFGGKSRAAQHAKAPRPTHRHDDITAMAERE